MKNKIKLSLIMLSVFAISANTQAMFRARFAQPQMPKLAHRSISFGRAFESRMPMPSAERQRVNEQFLTNSFVHKDLLEKRNEMALGAKNSTKSFLKYTLVSTGLTEWGMRMPLGFAVLLGGFYYGAISYGDFRDMRGFNKQKKALEAEIASLVKEQKQEIALADDIQ